MKLFIIYSDLANNEEEWKEALENLIIDYKHQVCLVTENIEQTKARLAAMGGLGAVECLEMKENIYSLDQIEAARKLTKVRKEDVIITMSSLESAKEFQRAMPDTPILMMNSDVKKYFNALKTLTLSEINKRSNSAEFSDIRDWLSRTIHEHADWWPVMPKKSLEAQRNFLITVLNRADSFPDENRNECILKTKAYFAKKGMLEDVLFAPPNITGLRWRMFSTSTPIAKIIEEAEKGKKAESDESKKLLSSSTQRKYGSF